MSSPTPVPLPDAQVPPPGQTGVVAPTEEPDGGRRILHEMLTSSWLVSVLAVVLALLIGGLLIAAAFVYAPKANRSRWQLAAAVALGILLVLAIAARTVVLV